MRALLQRVRSASVGVDGKIVGEIGPGLLVLAGMAPDDNDADRDWLVRKILALRIFNDDAGVMNRSVVEMSGAILVVSQFTLFASTKKGNRPSWSAAAPPEVGAALFDAFVATLTQAFGRPIATGIFGTDMQVTLVNDGPVTIWLDSRARE